MLKAKVLGAYEEITQMTVIPTRRTGNLPREIRDLNKLVPNRHSTRQFKELNNQTWREKF